MSTQIPLNYEASLGDTHREETHSLPPEVVQCLENARFLHLATCNNNQPHVSLMNYTYLPSSPYSPSPVIIMTTNPSSKKMFNLVANPNVSLLVHDWVSHRPPTHSRRPSAGSPGPEHRSSLASLLLHLNSTAVSSISATINGTARLVPAGVAEETYFRERHLENNTFDSESGGAEGPAAGSAGEQQQQQQPDGGHGQFVAGEDVRVIVVDIRDVRISDWKGSVRDCSLVSLEGEANGI